MDWNVRLKAFCVQRILRRPILFKDRYGVMYYLLPTDDLALYFRHRGWFEIGEQEFVTRYLRPGMTAVDVGAYIGVYTCLMARLVGPEGRVHAFEPSPTSFERLRANIAINALSNVEANRRAVSAEASECVLRMYGPPFESLSRLSAGPCRRGGARLEPTSVEPVEAVRLDEYCQSRSISRIDFLKLDVEGVELEALMGAARLLRQRVIRCLLIEVGERILDVVDYLAAFGYVFFGVSKEGKLNRVQATAVERLPNVVALQDE